MTNVLICCYQYIETRSLSGGKQFAIRQSIPAAVSAPHDCVAAKTLGSAPRHGIIE